MPYSEIDTEKAAHEAERINNLFDNFLQSNGFVGLTYNVNNSDLLLVIRKVDQRKHYFKEFHNFDLSELKEISLICFWLTKFRVYRVENYGDESINDSLNEKFCVYLIIHTIRSILKTKKIPADSLEYLSKEYIYQLVYSLRFRDLSKEALILLTETIALMSGIKPYHDLEVISNISESEID